MKTIPLIALALAPGLFAAEAPPAEIQPDRNVEMLRVGGARIGIAVSPSMLNRARETKGLEANGDAIDSILLNEELKTTIEKLKTPIVIRSMDDAQKYLTRASVEKINVNFKTHELAIFIWQGPAEDRLSGEITRHKGPAARFKYHMGKTKDLRTHTAIYTLYRNSKVSMTAAGDDREPMPNLAPQIEPRPADPKPLEEILD